MCTIKAAIAALEQHGGFCPKRCRTISRELINTGVIPMGAPGMAQVLSVDEFLLFFEALAFDPLTRNAREAAHRAKFLVPSGIVLGDEAPASIPRTAHDELTFLAAVALGSIEEQRCVVARQLEFVSSWPEFAERSPAGVARFVESGQCPQSWQARGQRKSTTISGGAFVDMIRCLFHR